MATRSQIPRFRSQLSSSFKRLWLYMGLGCIALWLAIAAHPAVGQDSPIASPTDRVEEGRVRYENGQLSESVRLWELAAQEYQQNGDRLNYALMQTYLSLAYQDLGDWENAKAAIDRSWDALVGQIQDRPDVSGVFARTFNARGNLELLTGQTEAALATWREAEAAYRTAGDEAGVLGSQLNQAQALQTLGLHRKSLELLESIAQTLETAPDTLLKAQSLRSLGVLLQMLGEFDRATDILERSLAIAQQLEDSANIRAALVALGNTARNQQDFPAAFDYYQQASELPAHPVDRVELQLNQLSLTLDRRQVNAAIALVSPIRDGLAQLAPSRPSIYARVNFAENLRKLSPLLKGRDPVLGDREIAEMLAGAIADARQLTDVRAESYAMGQLARVYEGQQRPEDAQTLTQKAFLLAQRANSPELTYRWQWQIGRLWKEAGQRDRAIEAYEGAIAILRSLKAELNQVNNDFQLSFNNSVEPMYRQFVEVLSQADATPEQIQRARETLETLQVAELDNFFRDENLTGRSTNIDAIDPHAAVFYPIVLEDRIEVVLSLPDRPTRRYATFLPQTEIEATLANLYQSFHLAYSSQKRLALSQTVYDWLIRPAEADLAAADIQTLVFVPDSFLRNIPLSALYDGEQYLVQKYAIALSPSLQLLEPRALEPKKLRAMAGGLTEARQGFESLPAVAEEVRQVQAEMPAEVLLDGDFTRNTLRDRLSAAPFNTVHLATHARFSSIANETFLLTWDGRVNVKELGEWLTRRQQQNPTPLELLVLSACQTAEGDREASLGLAGIAVRSGARSTLATLWSVRDLSTSELMSEFYHQLNRDDGISRAEALRQAQLALLDRTEYDHPFFWAPFVLVGNWL
ncbi:MAG TPA: CHAT domain-containing protein [Oscillatoriales cyanobacterium M59_W2019_021]|nr:CHAT domain-containing protein [Oscillatoriales cyanobacterium M4454_W2019_049]HIK53451.1 CHAT domain-containing protein [Oscillatoriales cyanobacterium M59_W2019_021]